jgi:hypothetical protein
MMKTFFPPVRLPIAALALTLAAGVVLGPTSARGADHLDSPRLKVAPTILGNLDVNDVYIFQGANRSHTVMIMTLSPAAGVLGPTLFATFGTYQFLIYNTGGTSPDLTIQFNFGALTARGCQPFVYEVFNPVGHVLLSGGGMTGQNNAVKVGGWVRADLFDDPFFFDLNAFNKFKAEALSGDPNAANVFLKRGVNNIPNNFFGGFNVLAIVVEVPSVLLQSSKQNTKIGVTARTLVEGNVQFDRMGRPGINTVLIPDADKDLFNSLVPAQDFFAIPFATAELTALFGNHTTAMAHAQLLLPDIMTFDTSSGKGFLNGRQLADDVIDAELTLLSNGVVTTDNVPNDSVFRTTFPYLGTPNPKKAVRSALIQSLTTGKTTNAKTPK